MADIAALKAAVDAAEDAKEALLAERRANRDKMTKAKFRVYNDDTRTRQVEVQAALDAATKALQQALNTIRSDALNVAVGTLSESETAGGAS